jgi:5-amino-6-(5-phosphoribosylamino)uracil reductase
VSGARDTRVFANAAVSLDGRLAPAGARRAALGTRLDRDRMHALRAQADAVLVGGATFRAWTLPYVAEEAALERLRARGEAHPPLEAGQRWWNVILTRSEALPQDRRFWDDPRVEPLVLTSGSILGRGVTHPPQRPPASLARGTLLEREDWTPEAVLDVLAQRGVRRLLLEGGAGLLTPFVAAGLVEELHLTICPLMLGGGPSLVAGGGPDGAGWGLGEAPRWKLVSASADGDEVYARYARA